MIINAIMQGIKQNTAYTLKTDSYAKSQISSFDKTAADRNFESYLKAESQKPDLPEKQHIPDNQLNNSVTVTPIKTHENHTPEKKYEPKDMDQNQKQSNIQDKPVVKAQEKPTAENNISTEKTTDAKSGEKLEKDPIKEDIATKSGEDLKSVSDAKDTKEGNTVVKNTFTNLISHNIKALEQEFAMQIKQDAKAEAALAKHVEDNVHEATSKKSGQFALNTDENILKFGKLNNGERIIIRSEKSIETEIKKDSGSKSAKKEISNHIEPKIENDSNIGQKNIFAHNNQQSNENSQLANKPVSGEEKINIAGKGSNSNSENEFGKANKESNDSSLNSKSKEFKTADNTAKLLVINTNIAEKAYNSKISKASQTGRFIDVKLDDISQKTLQLAKNMTPGMSSKARLILKPDSLGTVFVDLRMDADKLSINFRANNAETAKILESKIADLKEKLSQQGLKVENFEIRLKNESEENRSSDKGPGRNAHGKKEEEDLRKKFAQSFTYNIIEDAVAE